MSKIPSPPCQMESWARCLWGRIFSCSRGNCIFFFQFPFWYILEKYKFGLCTTTWIREFGLRWSFYFSKRISLCCRYRYFSITSLILSHLELSKIELPKFTPSIFMDIVTILVVLVNQSFVYMHQSIKAWLEKIIFELDYHRASLSLKSIFKFHKIVSRRTCRGHCKPTKCGLGEAPEALQFPAIVAPPMA